MQNEIVITLSLYALGAALLTYFLYRAITTAHRRGYAAGSNAAAFDHDMAMIDQTAATRSANQRLDTLSQELEQMSAQASQQLDATNAAWKRLDLMSQEMEQQKAQATQQLDTANAVIDELKAEKAQIVAVTPQEIGVLIQAANIIELAHRTWAPLKGVEPTARKASNVHQKLTDLNTRLSERAQATVKEQAA
ncbi:hypothetical protein NJC40_08630 [Pseudomonas sp. 21LCFQ02]|uniref:hypothetical protein n=1 Tax=Pseudomonas sp. 21LCFQ02 TaxID=2957505 RepID=UPI00209AC298|nr:hypothetical protein [Pseudomonas sp. 21LCFQ02]MCO8167842.1 hypothetical protein [Pseudomonas sp. 21LCFQ02]